MASRVEFFDSRGWRSSLLGQSGGLSDFNALNAILVIVNPDLQTLPNWTASNSESKAIGSSIMTTRRVLEHVVREFDSMYRKGLFGWAYSWSGVEVLDNALHDRTLAGNIGTPQ